MSIQSHQVSKNLHCPLCKGEATDATGEGTVKDGSIAICAYCGGINQYKITNGKVDLIEMTEEELADLKKAQPETFSQIMTYKAYIMSRMKD